MRKPLLTSRHQVIVQADTFGHGTDHHHLKPVIDGAKENMVAIGNTEGYFKDKILTADTSYHSTENIKKCEDEQIDAYIPDKEYRKRHPELSINKTSKASRKRSISGRTFSMTIKRISMNALRESALIVMLSGSR